MLFFSTAIQTGVLKLDSFWHRCASQQHCTLLKAMNRGMQHLHLRIRHWEGP